MKDQDGPWWMCEVHALKMTRTCAECALMRIHIHTQDEGAGMDQPIQDVEDGVKL